MFKKSKDNPLQKFGLNFNNRSSEDLTKLNSEDLISAASMTDSFLEKENVTSSNLHRRIGYIHSAQNWVIIRQNEQIIRQNEQILQLLNNPESPTSSNAPSTPNAPGDDSRFFS